MFSRPKVSKVNRPLSEFNGAAVVIGCSHHHEFCEKTLHPKSEDFYSIDFQESNKPDFVFNIQGELPEDFYARFHLTLIENLDVNAFSDLYKSVSSTTRDSQQGFVNIAMMTHNDGFILWIGCPAIKEFRKPIYDAKFKFIELNDETILIPKDRTLSIEKVKESFFKLNPACQDSVIQQKSNLNWQFCTTPYEQLPTISEAHKNIPEKK
jgi:hypothetical protein